MGGDIFEISTKNESLRNKRGFCDEKLLEESKAKLLKQIEDEKKSIFNYVQNGKTDEKTILLAYISYDKSWRSESYNNVSAKDRVQDNNLNQLKLKVVDAYKKDEEKQQTIKLLMMKMF